MPLSELPLSALVTVFLTVFVLIGINPALQRSAKRLRKLLLSASQPKGPFATGLKDVHAELFAEHPTSRPLNDFEIIVFQRLAQTGVKGLSRNQLNASLLFNPAIMHKALDSLHCRRLISVRVSALLSQRFALSEAGQQYAIEQGYMVKIHEGAKPLL